MFAVPRDRFLPEDGRHMAARRGVLHSVAQDVDPDLVEPQRVAHKVFFCHAPDVQRQVQALFLGHGGDDVAQVFHFLLQVEGLGRERELPALNAGDVQDVVDEGQQVVAGQGHFVQTLRHPLRVVEVVLGYFRHAHNGVHRRADVVAHGGEEAGLGRVGHLQVFHVLVQLPPGLAVVADIHGHQQRKAHHQREGQLPLHRGVGQVVHLNGPDEIPVVVAGGGVGEHRVAALRIFEDHPPRLPGAHDLLLDAFQRGVSQVVVAEQKLVEVAVLEHGRADEVGPVLVHKADLRPGGAVVHVPVLPQLFQLFNAQQQHPAVAAVCVPHGYQHHKSDALLAAAVVGKGAGHQHVVVARLGGKIVQLQAQFIVRPVVHGPARAPGSLGRSGPARQGLRVQQLDVHVAVRVDEAQVVQHLFGGPVVLAHKMRPVFHGPAGAVQCDDGFPAQAFHRVHHFVDLGLGGVVLQPQHKKGNVNGHHQNDGNIQ